MLNDMKSAHFSELLQGMSAASGESKKHSQHHQPCLAESEEICRTLRAFGELPLGEVVKWLSKSFRTRKALTMAIEDAASNSAVPSLLIEDVKNSSVGDLKAVCKQFGVVVKGTGKPVLIRALEDFITKKIALPSDKKNTPKGVAVEVARIKTILADDLTKARIAQFDQLEELFARFETTTELVRYIDNHARIHALTHQGFIYLFHQGSTDKGVLRNLLTEFSITELKKIATYTNLATSGSKDALINSIANYLQLPISEAASLEEKACNDFKQIDENVGIQIDISTAIQQFEVKLGVFTTPTLLAVADRFNVSATGNRSKIFKGFGEYLRRLGLNRTRG